MITTKVPYDFLRDRVDLSWRDIQFGLDRQLITAQVAIDRATDRLDQSSDASVDQVELASRSASDSISELVDRLADAEAAPSNDVQDKWLYVVLAWLFENRQSVKDPLGMVEEVYSDFDYPPEIAPFVRYMPMDGPDLESLEQNEARLYERWKAFLDKASQLFGRAD